MFVDGVQQAALPATTFILPHSSRLSLGGNSNTDRYDNYQGYLEHFVIVNRVMTASEIQAIMAETPARSSRREAA